MYHKLILMRKRKSAPYQSNLIASIESYQKSHQFILSFFLHEYCKWEKCSSFSGNASWRIWNTINISLFLLSSFSSFDSKVFWEYRRRCKPTLIENYCVIYEIFSYHNNKKEKFPLFKISLSALAMSTAECLLRSHKLSRFIDRLSRAHKNFGYGSNQKWSFWASLNS